MPRLSLPLALVTLAALAGCGGPVADGAPALLTTAEIAARAQPGMDPARGVRAERELTLRGERLRARAAALRRAGLPGGERSALLRRAEALKDR